MNEYIKWAMILALLLLGNLVLMEYIGVQRRIRETLRQTREDMEESNRRHLLEKRKRLRELEEGRSLWGELHHTLEYSGLRRRFHLTVEKWIAWNIVVVVVGMFLGRTMIGGLAGILAGGGLPLLAEELCIRFARSSNLKRVGENLPKFMDFLGNYSVTGGELGGILGQISVYLEDPLRSVLEECETECRLSGDISTSLLSMAEKVEHPQFQQLVRNMEITARYSTDFGSLVTDSRRSMREYLRQGSERRSLMREAGINMVLLTLMSLVVLLIVGALIGSSLGEILWGNPVGKCAIGVFLWVLFCFGRQIFLLNR